MAGGALSWTTLSQLYREYAFFNFDSAYRYAQQLRELSLKDGDSIRYKIASIQLNSVLLSSGLFKEVFESLQAISVHGLGVSDKANYYMLLSRSYFDLADYNRDSIFSKEYNLLGEQFIDSLLLYSDSNSFVYKYYSGLKSLRSGDVWGAIRCYRQLRTMQGLSLHEQAIVYSTFSDIYIRRGMVDSAVILLARASIADIHSSTKETTAILHLSNLLFKQGDIKNASVFVQKAALDAKNYGARQRMVQLSTVLPIIEAERLALVEKQKLSITTYATIITASFLILAVLILIVVRQVKKLKQQRSEISQKNSSLEHLVEEKQWLLKEVHHRVKNNLHTITSLLESQSAYLENEALQAIKDSQHRIYAMSLIHQKLYQPEKSAAKIDMSAYIHEMVSYLQESFETSDWIKFKLELEPVHLDISLAVPMGLILNEAITNSLKYAFPLRQHGNIKIVIKERNNNLYQFVVMDDGTGLPSEFDIEKANSLGMKLMKGLSDDIDAGFLIDGHHGTKIQVEFATDKVTMLHYPTM